MKKWLLILGPLVGGVLILSIALQAAKPSLERWALANLESFSSSQLPFVLRARDFHFDLFLPKAELIDVTIVTKPELEVGEQIVRIDRAQARLDLIQLLAGRLQLSAIQVEGLRLDVELDPFLKDNSKSEPINWGPIFRLLKRTPVTRLSLESASLNLRSEKEHFEADLVEFDLLLVNEQDRLQARLDLQDADVTWKELSTPVRAQIEATLSPQGLDITELRLLGLGSLLRGSASFTNLPLLLMAPNGTAQFELKASLPQAEQLLKKIKSAPKLEGSLEAKGNVELAQGSVVSGGFRVFGQRLVVDQFRIGQIETEGRIFNDTVQVPSFALTNDAGLVDIRDIEVKLERENDKIVSAALKAKAQTDTLDLHDLLESIGVGDLPLDLFISADIHCQGPLWPGFSLNCGGKADAEHLEVRTGSKGRPLVQVESFGASGDFTVDLEKVTYDAKVTAGTDEGKSSGVISYAKGFDIGYSTPKLHLSNIQHLAGLKLEGSAQIQGRTSGNSHVGRFQMQIDAQDFAFEDFLLGQPQGQLRYEKGRIYVENLMGTFGATAYQGDVIVDLHNDRLEAHVTSPRLDLTDVTQILERRLKIPVEITGTGVADVSLEGPLQINHLSYTVKSQFSRVTAAGESFDQVVAEVHSEAGEFRADRVVASRGPHQIRLTGEGHPSGQINFLVEGNDLPLEQSENISLLNSNISGLLNFSLTISDDIRSPTLALKANARNIVVEEQDLPNAVAEIRLSAREMSGQAALVGGRLVSSFRIPLDGEGPFALDLQARDWNFTTFFALLGAGPLLSEYQSSVTAHVDLKSERGGFWKSSGKAQVDRVFLKRGALSFENPRPLEVMMRSGIFSVENFVLTGPSTQVEVHGANNSREELDLRVKGQTELRLFQIFLPFLEEFSGRAEMAMTLGGSLDRPELLGSGRTENAFVKVKGFPHPFEKISSDVQFSQSRVLISQARGELAGGTFTAEGGVSIKGLRDFPTQIHAQINNVSMNVPDHVRTNGSGEVNITGNWFPFTLSGVYRVQGGLVDKEFGDDELQNAVRKSSYLPKIILQKAFEPLVLDLQVVLDRPLTVKNNLMEGAVVGQLQVTGSPTAPILLGQITADKGTKLLFRDKPFDVITANVKFSDPKEINPELYISARARVDEYDINLLVQGTAKAPLLRMTSLPPLSEQDIVSLLALGVTTASANEKKTQGQRDNTGAYQTQVLSGALQFLTPVKNAQKAAGVNVQISSSYDDTRNTEIKKITISKKFSDRAKVSASGAEQGSQEYKIEYALSPNLSAVGTFKQQETIQQPTLESGQQKTESILGFDLEYRREFR